LGFAALDGKESTRVVHDLLYSRLEEPPDGKLYDNGCNFHKTCMRIAPLFWRDCLIVIDREHQPNHCNCSPVFDMAHFPHLEKEVSNSQIAEQFHSELQRSDLTGSLCGMTQVNFMLSLRFFMFLHNIRARQNPEQILPLRILIENMQLDQLTTRSVEVSSSAM
jgi:hypothetical protein